MFPLHLLCLNRKPPLLFDSLSLSAKALISSGFDLDAECFILNRRRTRPSSSVTVHAVNKDAKQFEVDPDKAREALQKLDQQLQSLSQKQVCSPKVKASDVKLTREQTPEEETEFSGSFLAYITLALFLFSICYNVFFYTVIKPSVDGS